MSLTVQPFVNFEELIQQAEQMVERRNADALQLAEQATAMAAESGNARHYAYAKYIHAFYQCLVANNYDKAIELCNKALAKQEVEDLGDVAYKIYMTLGNSYQLKGDIFAAQESYMKGLKQIESRPTPSFREKGFLGSFYYNVSVLLSASELNISTEEYILKAISIFQEIGSQFKLSKSYVSYAGFFERREEFSKAIDILFKALKIDEETNDAYSIALTKANLGIMHLRIKKFDEALSYLNETLGYYQSNNMLYEVAMVKTNLGDALFASGKKEEGIKELLDAEDLFNRLENKRELSHVYELLSKFVAESGDYKKAWEYQNSYTESLKYFFDIEKTNALTRAKKEFETEQQEKEAAILKEKNEEIKRYVHKLEISNNELKQFAHVASHDLREPLRMITSYMGLTKRSLNGNMTEQQSEFIGYAIDGAKRMDQLIVDLLRLAKVDANSRLEKVKLANVVEEIKLNLDALIKEKNARILSYDLPEMTADRTQMLQLLQNIIGNGIKYNENPQPVVTVKSIVKNGELEITIADNGIGIPEGSRDKVFQIFHRVQTEKQYAGSGVGLTICKKIVDSMNGHISIETNQTGGTTFKITLPSNILL
ncbi:MAG TPA: ATP-binding protein [Chitinophagales bacterium]|nr:ATP-binding protein [Chitinophagales bacterium]